MMAHRTDEGESGWWGRCNLEVSVVRSAVSNILCPILFLFCCYCFCCLINCLLPPKQENRQCKPLQFHLSLCNNLCCQYNICQEKKGGGEKIPHTLILVILKARVLIKKSHKRTQGLIQIPSKGDQFGMTKCLCHLQMCWAAFEVLLGMCGSGGTVYSRLTEKSESNEEIIVSKTCLTLRHLEAWVGSLLMQHIRETQTSGSRIESLLCHGDLE